MTNRLSDLNIPELTPTSTQTHVCKYELTSLSLSFILDRNILALTYKHTPPYIARIYEHYYLFICYLSSFDKVKLFFFCFFSHSCFCKFSFVNVCLYKLCSITWNWHSLENNNHSFTVPLLRTHLQICD